MSSAGAVSFDWRAVDAAGSRRKGTLSARSEAEAYRAVAGMGLTPVSIKAGRTGGSRGRISGKDLAHFTQQLGVLLEARIPVSDGLLSIAEQEPGPELRAIVRDLAARIEAGETVASALEVHRRIFGDVYVETVRAAEKSGTLTASMEQLAEMLERAQETRQQIKAALTYPCVVLGVMVLGMIFLVGFVVPKFAGMFAQRGVQLPALTEALLVSGQSMQRHWYLWLAGAVAAVFGARRFIRSDRGRAWLEQLGGRTPVLKHILHGLALTRFCRVLGVSLSSGVGLISSLELAAKATGRRAAQSDIGAVVREVEAGRTLAQAMTSCAFLTSFSRRMLTAGETSGELPRMCKVVARHYDRETSHLTKALTTLIEPVLVVGIAGMVLVVAMAIFLPMWNMVNLLG